MRVNGTATRWRLLQWSNDWITAEDADTPGATQQVFSPVKVVLQGEEIDRMQADYDAAMADVLLGKSPHSGQFWAMWVLRSVGRLGYFDRRKEKDWKR